MPEANDEMVRGFLDGYNLDCPEPSANRSRSYRHGFMCGRRDKNPSAAPNMTFDELSRMADEAMAEDSADAMW